MEDGCGLDTGVGSLHPGTFVHRQLERQVGGAANGRPRFCEKKVGSNGGGAGKGVGDVGKDKMGWNVSPVRRLLSVRTFRGRLSQRKGQVLRPAPTTCYWVLIWGLELPPEISGPRS